MRRRLKNKSIATFDPNLKELDNLLKIYARLQRTLIEKTALSDKGDVKIFSTGNIVGEYAEILVSEKLDMIQEIASCKGYDCSDDKAIKVQVKSRWVGCSNNNGRYEMGGVQKDVIDTIDWVAAILFDEDFSIQYAFLIAPSIYKTVALEKANAYVLRLTPNKAIELGNMTDSTLVVDIKSILQKR